jgi:phosphoribosylanthranilate isomerase
MHILQIRPERCNRGCPLLRFTPEVSLQRAAEIFKAAGPYMGRVCVSHTSSVQDLAQMLTLQPTAIQISHPHTLPTNRPYQVIRVIQPGDPLPKDADAVIVDASMGKGALYDHDYAQSIISMSKIPVILAGGLNPDNVKKQYDYDHMPLMLHQVLNHHLA